MTGQGRSRAVRGATTRRQESDIRLREERPPLRRRGAPRGRRGRGLVDGWVLGVALVAVIALAAAGASAAARAGGRAKAGVKSSSGAAGTPRAAASGSASQSVAAEQKPAGTAVWGHMKRFGVALHFPANAADMVAIGYHQAWNTKATDMLPGLPVHPNDKYNATKAALKADPSLKLFLMMSRGRGSSEYSAADCAMRPGSTVLAPVDGVVTLVKTYQLAGYGTDYQVEIEAYGASPVRVVMIHLRDVRVKRGMKVDGGVTPIATVRHLTGIDNQVNRYLPVAADHTHIQINNVGYKLNSGS